ncbi:MAG: hypothetical protein IGS48_20440 [Oscillatoriales cyanobacterium C42_A2020_001]|nr:hypothetical protein [Leptolyngbyaceae cyanobacterium C42_A2020_001]
MRRPGWDARRRNRNIGTAKSGHGQNNQMQIAEGHKGGQYPFFYEDLENPVVLSRTIGDREVTFLVEPVQPGFLHACTPDHIAQVLRLLPSNHTKCIDFVVLRQPKRKEYLLESVWGRMCYWVEIHQYSGVAIYLEAQPINEIKRWRKSLLPDDVRELERLAQDGHQVIVERRHYAVYTNLESVRATQLYRTLPHEVGHYVDYLHFEEGGEEELFWSKPSKDKEAFAHRYATEFWEREKAAGKIPFERTLNEEALTAEGLAPFWFTSPSTQIQGIDFNL